MAGDNLIIIGMPGSGKTTFGRALANCRGMNFVDTDEEIARRYGYPLQDLLDMRGLAFARRAEKDTICALNCTTSVISTGGSVIYSNSAMQHLGSLGTLIYLSISLPTLLRRVQNSDSRGLIRTPNFSLPRLYHQRLSIYARWAQITLDNDWPMTAWQFARLRNELTLAEKNQQAVIS